jgi:hypothetical protein
MKLKDQRVQWLEDQERFTALDDRHAALQGWFAVHCASTEVP